jgi:hypothetical protein
MPKQRVNLSVERESLERGQRYSQCHGVSISRLVDDFLAHLPVEDEPGSDALTPDVRSLIGIGAGEADRETCREHLREKYGR